MDAANEPFKLVQLWDVASMPSALSKHVRGCRHNQSLSFWIVRGKNGPHDDPDYGPGDYSAECLKLDREVDDWLVEMGATPGTEIVWHIWW